MSPKLYGVGHENCRSRAELHDPSFAARSNEIDEYAEITYFAFSQASDRLQLPGLVRCAIVARKGMSPEEFATELETVAAQLRAGEGRRIVTGNDLFTDENYA